VPCPAAREIDADKDVGSAAKKVLLRMGPDRLHSADEENLYEREPQMGVFVFRDDS
jgi:hypothetical protein